jgi:hypothetical protein
MIRGLFFRTILVSSLGMLILLGAGCPNQDMALQPPTTVSPQVSTPEQAWETFKEGWKKQDINMVLSACSTTPEAQDRCRRQFEAVKASGHLTDMAQDLTRSTLTFEKDFETMRMYTFSADATASTVTFELIEGVGWKIKEF